MRILLFIFQSLCLFHFIYPQERTLIANNFMKNPTIRIDNQTDRILEYKLILEKRIINEESPSIRIFQGDLKPKEYVDFCQEYFCYHCNVKGKIKLNKNINLRVLDRELGIKKISNLVFQIITYQDVWQNYRHIKISGPIDLVAHPELVELKEPRE